VTLPLEGLPRYLVLEPTSTVRFELRLGRPPGEVDIELENPRPGRSFLLLVGPQGGPLVQRMRLTGRVRVLFEPNDARPQILMLANPQKDPLVLQIRVRPTGGLRRPARARRPRPTPMLSRGRRPEPSARPRIRLTPAATPAPAGAEVVGPPVGEGLRRARPKG
jgi:hypothetical protein